MGKRSKSRSIAGEELVDTGKEVKNLKKTNDDNVPIDEYKEDESITVAKDKKLKRKIRNNSQTSTIDSEKKNKKIIFNDDDDEPVAVKNLPQKRIKVKLSPENEEDVKDEDIDNFCNEITEEDNEKYENWVKLIEAKLHSNKKKPK